MFNLQPVTRDWTQGVTTTLHTYDYCTRPVMFNPQPELPSLQQEVRELFTQAFAQPLNRQQRRTLNAIRARFARDINDPVRANTALAQLKRSDLCPGRAGPLRPHPSLYERGMLRAWRRLAAAVRSK